MMRRAKREVGPRQSSDDGSAKTGGHEHYVEQGSWAESALDETWQGVPSEGPRGREVEDRADVAMSELMSEMGMRLLLRPFLFARGALVR